MSKFFVEIKNRIFLLFTSWLSLFFVFYGYKYLCVLIIVFLNCDFSNQILKYFIFTSVQELFVLYINLSMFFTQLLFYYIIFYHFICFFSWGMFKFEYFFLKKYFFITMFLGICSALFFQIILLPAILNFFFKYQMAGPFGLFFEAKLSEFLTFYQVTFKNCFVVFQICGALVLLASYFNFTSKFLKKMRKILYLFLLVFSTALTPPDVYSQLIIFVFSIICLESFIFCQFLKKNIG